MLCERKIKTKNTFFFERYFDTLHVFFKYAMLQTSIRFYVQILEIKTMEK